ncbi:hypothetical protein SOV92_03010 [Pectobacterium brasiliense]|uniref:Uncharacterized protein n=1 Tax=Pectobacterium brasiliense TaxID=180957 RepID=A0AAW9GXV8_9GAMM|nr:hypothetical protein [Pectobacterium brasiliense]MDY4376822.1 hypothetical protein [Pectobacterium brasiliense]
MVKETTDNLHEIYPKLAEFHKNATEDYQALVSGLFAPSEDKLSDTLVAQTRVIISNISQSEHSSSEICDNAMVLYFSSVERLSRTYSALADAYQNYSEENEKYRKMAVKNLSNVLGLETGMTNLVVYSLYGERFILINFGVKIFK